MRFRLVVVVVVADLSWNIPDYRILTRCPKFPLELASLIDQHVVYLFVNQL